MPRFCIGRSLRSCKAAYSRMDTEYPPPQYQPSYGGPIAPLQTSPGSRKRPLAPVSSSSQLSPGPRAIQPKPPHVTSHFQPPEGRAPVPIPRLSDPTTGQPPRTRGRPSKIEIQRRQAAQGMVDPYRPAGPLPHPPPSTTQASPMEGSTPGSAPPLSAPTTQQHTPTPPEQGAQPQQPASSPPTHQTHGTEARRSSAPDVDVGTVQPIATASGSGASKESTPRTILDGRVPPSSAPPVGTSVGPVFRMVNQSASDPGSPEGVTSTASMAAGATVASTSAQPVSGTTEKTKEA